MDDVDYIQRTADGPGDDQAERITRDLRRVMPYWSLWNDPVKTKRFVDEMRGALSGYDTTPHDDALLRQESEEKPFSSDEFWNSEEPKRQLPRKL